jgi:cytochrome P450
MLTPAFHFRILEDFLIIFNEQAKIMSDIMRKEFSDGDDRNICPYISRCTLDIIGETAMDVKFASQSTNDSPYLNAVNTACEIMLYRGTRPLAWSDFVFNLTPSGRAYNAALKTLHDFTEKVIRERKQTSPVKESKSQSYSNSDEVYWHGKRRLAFLDLLLDAQNGPENELTDLDIREEVDTFMFEGHDTTAASLSWTVFLLGCHQECQIKVQEELDRIFGDDKTRPIKSKDLTEMKYLEACIKEALRLYPSVPFISRSLTSDLVLDEKLKIPSGCDIFICTMPIHQNPEHFPDPQAFIPERFFPENTAKRHPFAYIPFSAGPRNCIGQKFALMEEKVVLATFFRNFNVEAAQTLDSVTVMVELITRPKNGLRVRLSNR